ncbi:MAG: flotillin family protein, partial [Saprospiraceae bacterium]|nr:flotillin family protein [Saprospiraceae bacterium]
AEIARAMKEKATREADIIVSAEIEKRQLEIVAEADAEQVRRRAKGEADAIFAKKEAEARGLLEILEKQAEGFKRVVDAAGGDPRDAVLMLIADKLPELVKTQVEAIKNIKIDKVTVWEGGNNKDGEANSTAKFISGLYQAVPPMNDLFNMAGMDLPKYLGDKSKVEAIASENVKPEKVETGKEKDPEE